MFSRIAFAVCLAVAFLAVNLPVAGSQSEQRIPCKTPANASSCYSTHGRLQFYNGTPSYRLWRIGTKRVLGVYSGPSVDRSGSLDNESPVLPNELLSHGYDSLHSVAYGDWEVCPLEAEKAGHMQAACVESVTNLVLVERQGEGQDVIRYDGRGK